MALILIGLSLYTLYRVVRRVPPAVLDDDAALRIAQFHAALRAAAADPLRESAAAAAAAAESSNGDGATSATPRDREPEDPGTRPALLHESTTVQGAGADDGGVAGADVGGVAGADDGGAAGADVGGVESAPTSLAPLDASVPSSVPLIGTHPVPTSAAHLSPALNASSKAAAHPSPALNAPSKAAAHPSPALNAPSKAAPSDAGNAAPSKAPDMLADLLAGEAGQLLLNEAAPRLEEDHGAARARLIRAGVQRTLALDAHWMAAHDARGVRQFVVLGAGLDARPWRLPHLDATAKVFEVDTPAMHASKAERLASAAAAAGTPCPCTRIVVEAPPLVTPAWADALLAAGFTPTEPSFFLCESVLMFLEPASVRKLLRTVVKLMCPGSVLAGDMVLGGSRFQPAYLQRWRAPWMSEVVSADAAAKLLVGVGLQRRPALETVVLDSDVVGSGQRAGEAGGDEDDAALAARLRSAILNLEGWPATDADWWIDLVVADGDAGVRAVAKAVVRDPLNLFGLRRATAQRKAHLCALVLADGTFSSRLRARVDELAKVRPRPTLVPRLITRTISTGLAVMAHVRRTHFALGTVVFCAQR